MLFYEDLYILIRYSYFRHPQGEEQVKKSNRNYRTYCNICSWGTVDCDLVLRYLLSKHNIDLKVELARQLTRLQNVEEELIMGSPLSKQEEEELVKGSPPLKQVEEELVMGSPLSQVEPRTVIESLRLKSCRVLAAATWCHFRGSQGTELDRNPWGACLKYCKICSWPTCAWEDACKHLLRKHKIDVEGRQEQILRLRREEEPGVNEQLPIPKRGREEEQEVNKAVSITKWSHDLADATWTHFHHTLQKLARRNCRFSMRCNICLWPTLRLDHARKHLISKHGIDVGEELKKEVLKRARVNEELRTRPFPLNTHNVCMPSSDTNIPVNLEQAAHIDKVMIGENVDTFLSDTRISSTTGEPDAHYIATTGNDANTHSSNTNNSVTPELAAPIDKALAALPRAHLKELANGEIFQSRDEALKRLQDWAITQGFVVFTESCRPERVVFRCIYRKLKKKLQNTRTTCLEDRERPGKKKINGGCLWKVYISKRKATGKLWVFGWSNCKHNHPLNPNSFFYPHHDKQPYLPLSTTRAIMEGVASYTGSSQTLSNEGLPRPSATNLDGKNQKSLTKQEEISQILHHLKKYDFNVQVRYEHDILGQGVAKDIFFICPEQIELGRQFVSGFVYQTDATFSTEGGRLPLSSMIGVTNTGQSFPFAYCYITRESAVSFEFVARELTKYVFNGCPEAEVIIADFTQGLGAAIAAKARMESTEHSQMSGITEVLGGDLRAKIRLQLSESHATETIKKRLIHGGQYTNGRREEITNLVDDWIKASTDSIFEAREKLLERLDPEDREYLISQYQPQETIFLRAYTRTYRNLGCDSTQRNAECYPITKRTLYQDQSISKAIEYIVEDLRSALANHCLNVYSHCVLVDLTAFRDLGGILTSYCLEKAMREWAAAKILAREEADALEKAVAEWATAITREEVATVDGFLRCTWACELPLRYGIPCRHWMYPALIWKCQLPLSLFHPRWLREGPRAMGRWKMSWGNTTSENEYCMSAKNNMRAEKYNIRAEYNMSPENLFNVNTENEFNTNTGNDLVSSAGDEFNMGVENFDMSAGNEFNMSNENEFDMSNEKVFNMSNENEFDMSNENVFNMSNENVFNMSNQNVFNMSNENVFNVSGEDEFDTSDGRYWY